MTATVIRCPTFGATPDEASPSAVKAVIPRLRIARLDALADAAALSRMPEVEMFFSAVEAADGYALAVETMELFLRACGAGPEARAEFVELMMEDAEMRAAKIDGDTPTSPTPPAPTMVLTARTPISFGGKLYNRGCPVPLEVLESRNAMMLLRSSLEWRPAGRATAKPVDLPPPEPPMVRDPDAEVMRAIVRDAVAKHHDPVQRWLAAVAALEALLDPRRKFAARDLLLGAEGGSSLHANAVGEDARRTAITHNLTARRPVRAL